MRFSRLHSEKREGSLDGKWSDDFLRLVMCWYYEILQSRGKDAHHKFHLPLRVLRNYSFDNSAENNGNTTCPMVKASWGRKSQINHALQDLVTLLPTVSLSCQRFWCEVCVSPLSRWQNPLV